MFLPEKMMYLDLLMIREARLDVTRFLAEAGCLHIVEQAVAEQPGIKQWAGDRKSEDFCNEQLRRIELLLSQLGVSSHDGSSVNLNEVMARDVAELLSEARDELDAVADEIEKLFKRRHEIESRIRHYDMVSEELHLLDECGISPATLDNARYLYTALGSVSSGALERIAPEFGEFTCTLHSRSRGAAGNLILLVGDPEAAADFDRILNSAGFERHKIDERFRVDFSEGMELVEMELWSARDELALVNGRLNKQKAAWGERLEYWRRVLKMQSVLLKATAGFGAVGESVVMVSGFLPRSRGKKVLAELEERFAGNYFAELRDAEELEEQVEVPTRLKNWRIFRPFELFIKNYGLPRYDDIDPTPFVAISFLVMFGMMFGDVGHGLILGLAGAAMAFLPYNIFNPARDLGKILMMSGGSAIIYGFLFGSVFGIERDDVLPALWMRPSHGNNLMVLMGVAMVIGVVIISLGIILNIIQSFRQRDVGNALVGEWSLSSLVFYWMMLGLVVFYSTGHSLPIPTWLLIVIAALPLVLIVGGQLALMHFGESHGDGEEHDMATLLFEPIEILMSLFTNSASFLRVAAFGLAHAALTMVIYILKDMVDSNAINLINVPIQHLFVIVLEGMIVTIQCLRLEYYEFFSKFYRGDGKAFVPLVIEPDGE